jgi:hypothetical protein
VHLSTVQYTVHAFLGYAAHPMKLSTEGVPRIMDGPQGYSENLPPRGRPREKKLTQEVQADLLELHQDNPRRSAAKVARLYEEKGGVKLHRNTVLAVLKKVGPS